MVFNKKFKLQSYFDNRIPLCIYRRNNVIYFQTQIEVARADGLRRKTYTEEKCKIDEHNIKEVGILADKLLKSFEDIGDLSIAEFKELVGMDIEQYESIPKDRDAFLKFYDAKDTKDLDRYYDSCSLYYNIFRKKYSFNIWWHKKGCQYPISCDSSQGEKGILTFDTPLEFTDHSDPEKLGKIIIEALDRSRKISDKVAGNPYPEKTIELLSGTTMIVSAPRDKHFSDCEDYGVGELHQAYLYFPKEGADSSAEFYLGIAAELDCDLSEDNIRHAWEKLHGKAEFFEVIQAEHGIWGLRAEMRNKSVHRISYLLQIDESELLDCTMELHKPNTRKKLDEKLTAMFEEFARHCKFKD
jgi:hypothetical protein